MRQRSLVTTAVLQTVRCIKQQQWLLGAALSVARPETLHTLVTPILMVELARTNL